MMNVYTPKSFKIQEFVDPATYKKFGENSLLVMDYRILQIADAVREHFGIPVTINNWHIGGEFCNRGFRPRESKVGASYSQHRFGRAIDFNVGSVKAETVRKEIANLHKNNIAPFNFITAMETDISWVHIDCRITNQNGVMLFKP